MKIIGFNGPPRTGKDTLANMLADRLRVHMTANGEWSRNLRVQILSLSKPMRLTVYALMGIPYTDDHYEANKDVPVDILAQETIRMAMIRLSEEHVIPRYGEMFWAKRTAAAFLLTKDIVILPDIGFQREVDYFCERYGKDNFLLVHTYRQGKNWMNDSRGYVSATHMTTIFNSGPTLDDARTEAFRLYGRLLNSFRWEF